MPGAIAGTIILSSISSYIFAYVNSYGKSDISISSLVFAFLCSILFFAFLSYGLLLVQVYLTSGMLNKFRFFLWFGVVVLVPFGMFTSHYVPQAYKIINYLYMDFEISYHNSYPIYVEEVKFINSTNGKEVILEHLAGSSLINKIIKKNNFSKLSLEDRFKK